MVAVRKGEGRGERHGLKRVGGWVGGEWRISRVTVRSRCFTN